MSAVAVPSAWCFGGLWEECLHTFKESLDGQHTLRSQLGRSEEESIRVDGWVSPGIVIEKALPCSCHMCAAHHLHACSCASSTASLCLASAWWLLVRLPLH